MVRLYKKRPKRKVRKIPKFYFFFEKIYPAYLIRNLPVLKKLQHRIIAS